MKIPQRDVNLSRKLVRVGNDAMWLSCKLLDSTENTTPADMDGMLAKLENDLFDTISYVREYRRKVSPIELKGQRG